MKKIAIVTKYMMAGGIEKALINMLNTFSKEKYDVTLYVEKLGGDFFEDIPSYVNVKVIPEIDWKRIKKFQNRAFDRNYKRINT